MFQLCLACILFDLLARTWVPGRTAAVDPVMREPMDLEEEMKLH